jgi:hypothetical protein
MILYELWVTCHAKISKLQTACPIISLFFWYFLHSCGIFCTATVHLAAIGRKSTVLKHSDIQLNEFLNLALTCSVTDLGCLSRIRIFTPSRIRIFSIPDPGSASKNLRI